MNILHIIPTLRKGGAERIVLDTCIELQKRSGVRVKIVTLYPLCEYPDLVEKVDWEVVPARYVPSITRSSLRDINALEQVFASYNPDITHTHLWEAELVSRQVGYTRGRWFTHFHDNMRQLARLTWPISKQKLTDWYERRIILSEYKKRDSHFIAISKHCEEYARKSLPPIYHSHITHVSNAINVERFEKKIYYEKGNHLIITSIGSLVEKKNHAFLIEIACMLQKQGVKFTINIIGDGILRQKLLHDIAAKELQEYFILHGRVDDPETILWKSTLYVHPARYEPFGLVLLEAMAAGLPVVSLNGGGNADIMVNGKNGFIINNEDPILFAEKILEIWHNRRLYKEMSEYAADFALRFDIKEYVDKLLVLYGA